MNTPEETSAVSEAQAQEDAPPKEGTPATARGWWWSTPRLVTGAVILSVLFSLTMLGIFGYAGIDESGPVETVQVLLWIIPATMALGGAFWLGREIRRVQVFLGGMGLCAGAREGDLHVFVNPANMGEWGVRYRLRWWMSTQDPILPRLMWIAIFVIVGTATVHVVRKAIPVIWTKHRWMPWMLLMMLIAGALGWISDDILRPLSQLSHIPQAAEETFETVSSLLFAMIVLRLRFEKGLPKLGTEG